MVGRARQKTGFQEESSRMEYRAGLGSQKAQAQAKRRECSKWENQEVEIVEEPTHLPSLIQWAGHG